MKSRPCVESKMFGLALDFSCRDLILNLKGKPAKIYRFVAKILNLKGKPANIVSWRRFRICKESLPKFFRGKQILWVRKYSFTLFVAVRQQAGVAKNGNQKRKD